MKPRCFFLIALFILIPMATGHTQDKATAIDSLLIELLPDYDRASVLVLLTGDLPADTKLPATVLVPIPKTAQLNAVARIDSSDGQMKDDILSSPVPNGVSFITPDLRFRKETVRNMDRRLRLGFPVNLRFHAFHNGKDGDGGHLRGVLFAGVTAFLPDIPQGCAEERVESLC